MEIRDWTENVNEMVLILILLQSVVVVAGMDWRVINWEFMRINKLYGGGLTA